MAPMVRVAIVAFAAAALAPGAASGASGADTFRMPSGNVFCAYEHYSFAPVELRCEIRSGVEPLPPRPQACGDAVWGAGYSMRPTSYATVLCISDTVYDPKAKVLRYGTTWHGGGFTCTSNAKGLRCTNRKRDGFFLSRQRSYTFSARTRNGAFRTPSGNIVCGWSVPGTTPVEASIECGIKSGLKPPPPRVHCDAGDPNDKRVSLTATGRAVPTTCAGDPGPFVVEKTAHVLAYGRTWSAGGISCVSRPAGLTCTNRRHHGFLLSRERWRAF
jgi:Family of unknown function (DUF6636)